LEVPELLLKSIWYCNKLEERPFFRRSFQKTAVLILTMLCQVLQLALSVLATQEMGRNMKRCAALWHLHAWKALKFHKKTIHLAPIFDHGLSLLFSCTDDSAVAEYDVMADKRVNNFIGSSSTWENLHMIPKEKLPQLHALKETDRNFLMNGLDGIISQTLQDKIWEMIWKRWCAYEDLCHSR